MENFSTNEPGPRSHAVFNTTHWSLVVAAGDLASPVATAALESLCRTYWYPLYAFARRQGNSPSDAQDLTQGFFARLLEKNYLATADRRRGRFRSFLLTSLKHFLANEHDRATALKRGGVEKPHSLDDSSAEERFAIEPVGAADADWLFDQQWAFTVLDRALDRVRADYEEAGNAALFGRLKAWVSAPASDADYALAGLELGMNSGAVAVAVHRLRTRYREFVRREIADTVANPGDVEDEMRHLLAVLQGAGR